jgi:hypothetical protein
VGISFAGYAQSIGKVVTIVQCSLDDEERDGKEEKNFVANHIRTVVLCVHLKWNGKLLLMKI